MAETKKKDATPQYVRVITNGLPDKQAVRHQAGQLVAADQFNDVETLLADGKVERVAAEAVVAPDAIPTPALLKTLTARARAEDAAVAAAQTAAAAGGAAEAPPTPTESA